MPTQSSAQAASGTGRDDDLCLLSGRYVGKGDGITISVWNRRKIHKKAGSGFLGCVRIVSSAIHRLKDTGCKYPHGSSPAEHDHREVTHVATHGRVHT